MSKATTLFTAAALAMGVSFAASAQDLRIGLQDDPDTLDPAKNFSFVGRHVLASICDKLIDVAPDQTLVPQLATSWETSADGLTRDVEAAPQRQIP